MVTRLEFTAPTKRDAYARSQGVCECYRVPWLNRPNGCGVKLGAGNTFYEHIIPDNIRPDNSLDNCACLSKTCWREKTDTYDLPSIAKSNRIQDRARGIRSASTFSTARTSPWRKKLNGEVVRRS